MTDKDHDKDKDKHEADKHEADKHEADKHAANKTLSPKPAPATAGSLPPEDLMTEQEKDKTAAVPGVGPVSPAEAPLPVAESMEDLGIGPRTPYPTGNPPPPSETTTMGQGIKGVTDKPAAKPGEVKGPVHKETVR
jgi:hypothetical protein